MVEHPDGTFEVVRNGRPLASGLSDRQVQRFLGDRANAHDQIKKEDPDGYQHPAGLSDFRKLLTRGESPARR